MIITLLFYSLIAEALSFVIPDEKIESLCRFEVDFRIAHILRYPSNSNAFGHRGHNILQWQFLFWHGNRIISSQTRYKRVLFVHSCGRRHFKQSVSSRQRLSIFSSGITNERASACRERLSLQLMVTWYKTSLTEGLKNVNWHGIQATLSFKIGWHIL